jgi:hypothetical protein
MDPKSPIRFHESGILTIERDAHLKSGFNRAFKCLFKKVTGLLGLK